MRRGKRFRPRFTRWFLLTIGLLFAASAGLRMAGSTGAAIAREVGGMIEGEAGQAPPRGCAPAPEIADLLAALQQRETAVQSREEAVSSEMLALNRARQDMAAQLAALAEAEASLEATLALADGAAENDIAQLTGVYEAMKPKDAAALFQEMDPKFAAGFLGRMAPPRAAAVMSGMEPKAAYTISLILAGRNGQVPTD